jgi:hypothetical protein
MQKYKVEFSETHTYVVDVEANDEQEARNKADKKWLEVQNNGTWHQHEVNDAQTEISQVYNVTHTDDPFNP